MLVFVPILKVADLKHYALESDHHDVEPERDIVGLLLMYGLLNS